MLGGPLLAGQGVTLKCLELSGFVISDFHNDFTCDLLSISSQFQLSGRRKGRWLQRRRGQEISFPFSIWSHPHQSRCSSPALFSSIELQTRSLICDWAYFISRTEIRACQCELNSWSVPGSKFLVCVRFPAGAPLRSASAAEEGAQVESYSKKDRRAHQLRSSGEGTAHVWISSCASES